MNNLFICVFESDDLHIYINISDKLQTIEQFADFYGYLSGNPVILIFDIKRKENGVVCMFTDKSFEPHQVVTKARKDLEVNGLKFIRAWEFEQKGAVSPVKTLQEQGKLDAINEIVQAASQNLSSCYLDQVITAINNKDLITKFQNDSSGTLIYYKELPYIDLSSMLVDYNLGNILKRDRKDVIKQEMGIFDDLIKGTKISAQDHAQKKEVSFEPDEPGFKVGSEEAFKKASSVFSMKKVGTLSHADFDKKIESIVEAHCEQMESLKEKLDKMMEALGRMYQELTANMEENSELFWKLKEIADNK